MIGVTGDVVVGRIGSAATPTPLQTVDLSTVVDIPGSVRGPAAFALVLLLGVAIAWRFEPFLVRSVDATMDRPLVSVVYGAGALGVFVFASAYLASQLSQIPALGRIGGTVGLAVGGLLIVGASSLGFAIVGSMVVELWSGRGRSGSLVVGSLIAGGAAAIEPAVGGILWFVVVSVGIGGPVREWINASAGPSVGEDHRG